MDAVNKLLDTAKRSCSLPTDTALAERLQVSRQLVSQWRNGLNPIPEERIAAICAMAKLDAALWATQIASDYAKTPAARKMWENAARRLGAAAVIVLAALPALQGVPAVAAERVTSYALCVMRRLNFMRRRFTTGFA